MQVCAWGSEVQLPPGRCLWMQDKMESVRDGQMLLQLWGRRAGEPEPRERQALVPFLFPKLQNKRLHTHTQKSFNTAFTKIAQELYLLIDIRISTASSQPIFLLNLTTPEHLLQNSYPPLSMHLATKPNLLQEGCPSWTSRSTLSASSEFASRSNIF